MGDGWFSSKVRKLALIVEFAEQLIERGRSVIEAAIEAAELRLRPILMTSFAFLLGVLPLYFATGAGKLGSIRWERRLLVACCSPPFSTCSSSRCCT